jgi:hypothetical protein
VAQNEIDPRESEGSTLGSCRSTCVAFAMRIEVAGADWDLQAIKEMSMFLRWTCASALEQARTDRRA